MLETMKKRHSVRHYTSKKIEREKQKKLLEKISEINMNTGLNFQACFDEPKAFDTFMAHYGKFENVSNYIALVGKKGNDEAVGYYGEQIVLEAQKMGLNTCWVALTYGKGKTKVLKQKGEKIYCVIAIGYGITQGVPHKSKLAKQVCNLSEKTPDWFENGIVASLLAPTAMNQQKFRFEYIDGKVFAKAGTGFYTKIDLGIARYHFELGANRQIDWAK